MHEGFRFSEVKRCGTCRFVRGGEYTALSPQTPLSAAARQTQSTAPPGHRPTQGRGSYVTTLAHRSHTSARLARMKSHSATFQWLPRRGILCSFALLRSEVGGHSEMATPTPFTALLRSEVGGHTEMATPRPFTVSRSGCARSRGRSRSRGPATRSARSVAWNTLARAERAMGEQRERPGSNAERSTGAARATGGQQQRRPP